MVDDSEAPHVVSHPKQPYSYLHGYLAESYEVKRTDRKHEQCCEVLLNHLTIKEAAAFQITVFINSNYSQRYITEEAGEQFCTQSSLLRSVIVMWTAGNGVLYFHFVSTGSSLLCHNHFIHLHLYGTPETQWAAEKDLKRHCGKWSVRCLTALQRRTSQMTD